MKSGRRGETEVAAKISAIADVLPTQEIVIKIQNVRKSEHFQITYSRIARSRSAAE
jgi:hypothetical protein